jgi:signal transduction histidine kinase
MVDFKFFADSFGIVKTDRTDFYIGLLAVVLSWIIAIFYGVKESRLEVLESLEESVSKLSWVNARLGSQLWTERQHLASVVHRDVQGKLISAALKFQKELSENNPNAKVDLNETLKSLTNDLVTNPRQISIRQSISELNDIWDGVFKIDLNISSELEKRISNDPVCCAALNDFFGEFATNSVKHGKATKGEINLSRLSDHTIKVTFTNNGLPFGENLMPGLGSKMSLQQTLSIARRNLDQGGVEVEAVIPVA